MKRLFHKDSLPALSVFATALAVRLLYLYQQSANPFADHPTSDTATYLLQAMRILGGDWLGDSIATQSGEVLYVYLLAAVVGVFGKSFLPIRLIQFLMGAVTCTLIYLTAKKVLTKDGGDENGLGGKTALVVGLWSAVFMPLVFQEWALLTSAPAMVLLAASLYTLLFAIHSGAMETGRARIAFAAGVLLALAALFRTNLLLLAPVYVAAILIKDPKGPKACLRTLAPYALVIGAALTVLPVTVKNYVLEKDLVLVSSTGGLAFFIGNNPEAAGVYTIPLGAGIPNSPSIHTAAHELAERDLGRKLKPSEGSGYWSTRGMEYLKENPGAAMKLYRTKLALFFNDMEADIIYEHRYFEEFSWLLRNPLTSFGPLIVFGLLGAFWTVWSGTKEERLACALLFVYTASVMPFFITSRLRLAAGLFLFILAGAALKRLAAAGGGWAGLKVKAAAAAVCVAIFFVAYHDYGHLRKRLTFAPMYLSEAGKGIEAGDMEYARAMLGAGLGADHETLTSMARGGAMAERMGETGLAKRYYRLAVETAAGLDSAGGAGALGPTALWARVLTGYQNSSP